MAAVGVAVAVLSALLIQEPAREFPTAGEPGAGDNAATKSGDKGGGGAGEESEERESFQEALGIVFNSNTVRLVRKWVVHADCIRHPSPSVSLRFCWGCSGCCV